MRTAQFFPFVTPVFDARSAARIDRYASTLRRVAVCRGLRIMEGARLRVKDLDLWRREILVRDGKAAYTHALNGDGLPPSARPIASG
jgi:integrase